MSRQSNIKLMVLLVLSVSLIAAATTACLLTLYYHHVCFQIIGGLCENMIQKYPDSRQMVLSLLKTQDFRTTDETILSAFGYSPSNLRIGDMTVLLIFVFGFFTGAVLFLISFLYWRKKLSERIQTLTCYLEKINTGSQGLLWEPREDEFSMLQDELYKTVTALYQTRDAAVAARNNFAENLSNIAHQLKTPITSISLTLQMAREHLGDTRIAEIGRQIRNLTRLEEALLLLSRIDAGTLTLERKSTDVFTLLTLASDNLYSLAAQKGVEIAIQEMGEMDIHVDLDWTMEAVMNLMKNCVEAAETDTTVHCSYEKNPLYVQIRIWDEGEGFAKEDLPHLFKRFYRGKQSNASGIGIGLSLSKAIIEMQNGIIRAFNLPDGGACFEIRFYT